MKNKKVLITGGAGFIGSHLAKRLAHLENEVTILDCTLPIKRGLDKTNIRFVQGSVTNIEVLRSLIPKQDIVFHLAARLGVRTTVTEPVEMIENNFFGTANVLKIALETGTKVVFASTSEVYGKGTPPFDEEMGGVYGPSSRIRWSYAIGKSLEECMCLGYGMKGLPVTIVRYFNIYGPYAKDGAYGGVVPRFVHAALTGDKLLVYGDGSQIRCFTYVSDAVDATIRAGETTKNQEIFNIGSENIITIKDLANKIIDLTGSSSPIEFVPFEKAYPRGFEEIPYRIPNLDKSKRYLGYIPTVGLDDGLKETILWAMQEKRD